MAYSSLPPSAYVRSSSRLVRQLRRPSGVSICKIADAKKVAPGTTLALLHRITTTYYISLIS